MNCGEALLSLLLLGGCEDGGSGNEAINAALAHPERPAEDREADPRRRPDRILSYFEIEPGMTVLDLFSGGGYYSELLSHVVGDDGRVISHNNQAHVDYARDTINKRYTEGRLKNVQRITVEANELSLPDRTLDAVLMILTYHDFYYLDEANNWGAIDAPRLLQALCAAMKPGAVLGVVDHIAEAGSGTRDAQQLHRIDPAYVKQEIQASCFDLVGESNALRNTGDDYSKPMFAEGVRGKTDRFIYKFRRRG